MALKKADIVEKVQNYLDKLEWQAAIAEMEKLFSLEHDPLIRVRIGDIRMKLNRKSDAVKEYVHAADLFAEKGFIGKALAQYNLALKLDPSNAYARSKREMLRSCGIFTNLRREPVEYRIPQPQDARHQYIYAAA